MVGLGTAANVAAILLGGLAGLLLRGGLKERHQKAVLQALGVCIMFIGASGALPGMLTAEGGRLTGVPVGETLGMVLAFALGTLLGELLDFEGNLERLGAWLKEKASRGEDSTFIQGFVTASLTVCIGAMAVVGSIQDGLTGDPSTLFTKSILDCIIIMLFASTYGRGAVFSALPVGVFQGTITLLAGLLAPVFSQEIIGTLSCLGSVMIFCVGSNLAFGPKFRVANMLPALAVGAVYTALL